MLRVLFEVKRQHSLPHLLFIWKQIACLCEGRWPGVARHASNFLSRRRKKVTKERATLLRASLRCATGNLRCSHRGCAAELTARYALRSNNCGKSVHEVRVSFGTRTHPLPCASRHAQKGTRGTSTRAIASLRCARPHLAGASATRCAGAAERSDGPNGCPAVRLFGCLDVRLSHPCWLRLRRGRCGVSMGVGAPMPRALTRRGCLNEAATQRSEFHGAPRSRPAAGLPLRNAKGSQTGGRLFFGDFLLAKQKKVTRTPGDSRLPHSTRACSSHRQNKLL